MQRLTCVFQLLNSSQVLRDSNVTIIPLCTSGMNGSADCEVYLPSRSAILPDLCTAASPTVCVSRKFPASLLPSDNLCIFGSSYAQKPWTLSCVLSLIMCRSYHYSYHSMAFSADDANKMRRQCRGICCSHQGWQYRPTFCVSNESSYSIPVL
eukprot:scpid103798/ scgid28196/ 